MLRRCSIPVARMLAVNRLVIYSRVGCRSKFKILQSVRVLVTAHDPQTRPVRICKSGRICRFQPRRPNSSKRNNCRAIRILTAYYEITCPRALAENPSNSLQLYLDIGIRYTETGKILKWFPPILLYMWVLSPELVLNLVLNLAPMDTKFSTGGDGSHPGKHGIAAETGCSKTACSAAPHTSQYVF